jgi:tight adherence protein C
MQYLISETAVRIAWLAMTFLLVATAAFVVSSLIERRVKLRERLGAVGPHAGLPVFEGSSLRAGTTGSAWTRMVAAIEHRGISLADTKGHILRKKLIAAGYTAPEAPQLFTFIRLLLTISLPAAFVTINMFAREPVTLFRLYMFGSILALIGLYLPNFWVTRRAERRQRQLVNAFPDALDLMLVCVEAGLGLEAAFDRVGQEMSLAHPVLSELLGNLVLELRAGRSREEAMHRMADLAGIDEIRSFATLIIQSDKLGSSIGQTLRIYATEMRVKRRMRAEEKAHRLPVLLSIPLVACMLPVMIGVLMLPAGIRVVRQVMPSMAHHGS